MGVLCSTWLEHLVHGLSTFQILPVAGDIAKHDQAFHGLRETHVAVYSQSPQFDGQIRVGTMAYHAANKIAKPDRGIKRFLVLVGLVIIQKTDQYPPVSL